MAQKPPLSSEDIALFRQSVGPVEPLRCEARVPVTRRRPKPHPRSRAEDSEARFDPHTPVAVETLGREDAIAFTTEGVQKNVLRKIRKGHYPVEADLDLHGLDRHTARQRLLRFLHECLSDGLRCVQIIHGKGYRSSAPEPILKNHLNRWLRQHQDVLAFCSAPRHEGGTGALYVLLRASAKFGEDEHV